MSKRQLRGSQLRPLFAYGLLLAGPERRAITPHIDRAERATVPASALSGWPATRREEPIAGEILWFAPDDASKAYDRLRKMNCPFEMATVVASITSGTIDATSWRWRGPQVDLESYCNAAERKVEIAEYELANLRGRSTRDLPFEAPVGLQADFEGVLHAFDAAVDQLATGLGLGRRHWAAALPDVNDCVNAARDWLSDETVREIAAVRNAATHGYYDKRARGGLWQITTYSSMGDRDHGDVVSFASRAVAHLRQVRPILTCLQSQVASRTWAT